MEYESAIVEASVNGNLLYLQSVITPENVNRPVPWVRSMWKLLEIVAFEGHAHCIPFLLDCGAQPALIDNFNRTPLDYAISEYSKHLNRDYFECCRLLIRAWPRQQNGVPVETPYCPLLSALEHRNFQAVAELTKRGWPLENYRNFCDNYEKYRIPFRQFYNRYVSTKNSIASLILTTRSPYCSLRRIIGKDMIHLIARESWEQLDI